MIGLAVHHVSIDGTIGLVYEILIIFSIVGGAILAVRKWANKRLVEPLREVPVIRQQQVENGKTLKRQAECLSQLHEGQKKILKRQDAIDAEFRNNDGHSIRDSNDRTEIIARAVAEHLGLTVPEPGDRVVQEEDRHAGPSAD